MSRICGAKTRRGPPCSNPPVAGRSRFVLTTNRKRCSLVLAINRRLMGGQKNELLPGTLNLLVLKTLEALGPLHGYGIARRIEQVSGHLLELNQGTIYPALLNLEQAGWVSSEWGVSENNRRAKYYSITRAGRKQLAAEEESWRRTSEIIARFLTASEGNA